MTTLEAPCETVYERVDRLLGSRDGCWPPLHTTSIHAVIAELIARDQCHEQAIRVIAMELQRLATDQEGLDAHH